MRLALALRSSALCSRRLCSSAPSSQASPSHPLIDIASPSAWPSETLAEFRRGVEVEADFVTEEEEEAVLSEVHPVLKRLRYEEDHTDRAIYMYREAERSSWSAGTEALLGRLRARAFAAESRHLSFVHILDLRHDGFIRPHIDNQRYCGEVIAGVSLGSSAVMRLVNSEAADLVADLLLPRRSLYRLSGLGRWRFTHEVLKDSESYFRGAHVPRERRVSIICRNLPDIDQSDIFQFKPIPETG